RFLAAFAVAAQVGAVAEVGAGDGQAGELADPQPGVDGGEQERVVVPPVPVAGLAPVKRNRFIALDGAVKSVNRELEARARDLGGLKGYVTNLAACPDGTPVTPE